MSAVNEFIRYWGVGTIFVIGLGTYLYRKSPPEERTFGLWLWNVFEVFLGSVLFGALIIGIQKLFMG